ncbi:hypothetical protein HMPREF1861_00850 [Corynebacterium kroppenstedtii]|nr:hypothetical protein HMPREF1861_00850 [Corynebacterium kroppenstedtii]
MSAFSPNQGYVWGLVYSERDELRLDDGRSEPRACDRVPGLVLVSGR